jgi:hypothetical protein
LDVSISGFILTGLGKVVVSGNDNMKKFLDKGKGLLSSVTNKVTEDFSAGFTVVKEMVNGLPIFVSLEKSSNFDIEYDEKHYFVVPYIMSEVGFSLHTMRCLPDSVPEINNLPKRRVFHFPNEHYEASLKHYMIQSARELSLSSGGVKVSSLEQLANEIDSLDSKLTYGMLLVGGIAAILNPLVGAGIAAKALLPGVGSLLTKYGLRPVGENFTKSQIEKEAKLAEKRVSDEFSDSSTMKLVNPILKELELAIRTSEEEHDPLTDPKFSDDDILELDGERWRELTELAVYRVYQDVYEDKKRHADAGLGPEDIRWLSVIFQGVKS